MSSRIDLTGKNFGNWTVLSYAGDQKWLCRCACAFENKVSGSSLRRGLSTGCVGCNPARMNRLTHGGRATRLYNIWCGMKARCENSQDAAFDRYGGRGIKVCQDWRDDFASFRRWSEANGYTEVLTIDRKNNDGHYEPDNCRWATYAEQNRNYGRNRPILHEGRYVLIGDLAAEHGLPGDVVKNRVRRYGWPLTKALSTPVQAREKREPWKDVGMSRSIWHRKGRPSA